jgi:hypothetical protein
VLREIAEYPNSFSPLGPRDERVVTDRYTLCMGRAKSWNTVQRQRMSSDDIDDAVEEVRALLRERGRDRTQWEVGSSAEPPDLVDRLLERGLIRDKEPYAVALVLTREPPPPPAGVVAKRVETFEEYEGANAVQWEAFEMPEAEIEELRPQLPQMWSETVNLQHIALIDGEVVAAGTSAPTEHGLLLFGGATKPSARGRGAYRAVLHARWQDAVANGTPALITQGGSMSRPILERLGFERVGEIHMLLDEFGGGSE